MSDIDGCELGVALGNDELPKLALLSEAPKSTHELALHFGSAIDFHDLQAALALLELRKLILLSNQGWKLI